MTRAEQNSQQRTHHHRTSEEILAATVRAKNHRLPEIDVLRGFAALWVVLTHYVPHWNEHLAPVFVPIPNSFGIYAVQLFFVISGFVIFMTLDRCRSVSEFAVLRFSRLYPTYWAALGLTTVASIVLFGGKFWLSGTFANATMFQEFLRYPHLDVVYWSLSLELAFYLNAAWLFALGWHRRVRGVVAVWLIGACVWALTQPVIPPAQDPQRGWLALLFALDFAPYFAIGVLFFDAAKHNWSLPRAGLIALAVFSEFLIHGWSGVAVIAVILLLFFSATRGYLRFLVSKPTLWLGAISYPLYLIHRNLGYEILDWLHAHGVGVVLAVLVAIAGAMLLATLLTYGIERPALARIRIWYRDRKVIPAT
jgi:peptidoglycan/LPS O-acetylase OafA/YrhL